MAIRTIDVLGNSIRKEAVASGVISPGEFLVRETAGTVDQMDGSVATEYPFLIAHENDLHGKGIDDDYADADIVQFIAPPRGGEVLAILADSQTITIGELLEVSAVGHVITAAGTNTVVGAAMEAVTTSGAVAFIRIEIA